MPEHVPGVRPTSCVPAVTSCPHLWVILWSEGLWLTAFLGRFIEPEQRSFPDFHTTVSLGFIFNTCLFLLNARERWTIFVHCPGIWMFITINKTRTVRMPSFFVPNLYCVCQLWKISLYSLMYFEIIGSESDGKMRWMSAFSLNCSLLNWEENLFHTFWGRKRVSFTCVDWFRKDTPVSND